jgi:hypothetical protein
MVLYTGIYNDIYMLYSMIGKHMNSSAHYKQSADGIQPITVIFAQLFHYLYISMIDRRGWSDIIECTLCD